MDFTEKERMNETMKKQNNLKRAIVVFLILVTCISMMSVTASAARALNPSRCGRTNVSIPIRR